MLTSDMLISGPTKCWARSGSKLFDTLMVFLEDLFEKVGLLELKH